jgi:7,8-dihydropterin-6-yl-methyl-4-(beta-D-ribofuranosyl)aminobenzene 5'-phosphate synthase
MHNLDALEIDPQRIDALAISHAHYDHTGGLPVLLERTRAGIPLYAHPYLFGERFSRRTSPPRSIGLSLTRADLSARTALRTSIEPQEIGPGVWTTGAIAARPEPEGRSAHHAIRTPEGWAPDPYRDDLSLVVDAGPGLLVLCGCCHAGLLNTLAHVARAFARPIVAVAGGVHLVHADAAHLRHVGQVLAEMGTVQRLYLNHCTGTAALHALRGTLGADAVHPCPAGTEIDTEVLE